MEKERVKPGKSALQNNEEAELIAILGEDKLKSMGECIVDILRQMLKFIYRIPLISITLDFSSLFVSFCW